MLSMYGVKDACTHKRKPRCTLKSSTRLGLFKRFQGFTRIYHVNEITYANLQGYISSILRIVDIDTINKHIGRLRRFLDFYVNMDYVQNNHANKLQNYKTKAPIRHSFAKNEWKQIRKNAKPRFLPFFELMLVTGLRPCDMWNLTRDNFPGGNFLYIKQEKTEDIRNVPISLRAHEIVTTLPYRLFPWADKTWWQERGEFDQRAQCINELWMCFGGRRNRGFLDRGKGTCKPKKQQASHIPAYFCYVETCCWIPTGSNKRPTRA